MPDTFDDCRGADGLIKFVSGARHSGLYGLVERLAVIRPLIGCTHGPTSRRVLLRHIAAATGIIRRALQRRRLDGQLAAEADYLRRADCRPAFVAVHPRVGFCHYPDTCIHCWARRAVATWQRVDAALFPGAGRSRPRRAACDLVLARRVYEKAALRPYCGEGGSPDLAAAFADHCSDRRTPSDRLPARGFELKRLRWAGALDLVVADVAWRSTGGAPAGRWRLEVRQVLAVEPGQPLDIPGARIRRLATPGRREVARAVAWFWRYPRGLVLRGDTREPPAARWVAKYLDAREGRRLFAGRGIFGAAGRREAEES
jgi:hypothetical protein